MQILIAPTEDIVLGEKSALSADIADSLSTIEVYNTTGFNIGDFIIIDELGSEIAELKEISSISTANLTITFTSALMNSHNKDSSITKIRFDKRKFYRSTSENGTYTHLSSEGSPINIQVDQPEGTEFEDTNGISSYWYKATYYNSKTFTETSLDDAVASKAGDDEHYTSIYKIKNEAGFQNNAYIGSDLVDRYRYEAEAIIESSLASKYQMPFSSIPKILQHITTLYAAGLLLSKEYGVESDIDLSKSGESKITRAENLIQKIMDDQLVLVGVDGVTLQKKTDVLASCSNNYSSDVYNKGDLFNLNDENFKFTDPSDQLADSRRTSETSTSGFED